MIMRSEKPFLIIFFSIIVVLVAVLAGRAYLYSEPEVPRVPCRDQAPPECLMDTVELGWTNGISRQFEHYFYCACLTADGTTKGYMAADEEMTKRLREIAGHEKGLKRDGTTFQR